MMKKRGMKRGMAGLLTGLILVGMIQVSVFAATVEAGGAHANRVFLNSNATGENQLLFWILILCSAVLTLIDVIETRRKV